MLPITYVLGKGGPSLLNLRLPRSEVRILITGPGMLYDKLRLVTSLGVSEGCHYRSMELLAGQLKATAVCGASGTRAANISVVGRRTSAVLEIEPGPMSMYQNELILETRNGRSFNTVLHKALASNCGDDDYLVALEPIPASGHHERHAANPFGALDPTDPTSPPQPGGHRDHGHAGHEHGGHNHG